MLIVIEEINSSSKSTAFIRTIAILILAELWIDDKDNGTLIN